MVNDGTISLRLGSELRESIKNGADRENRTQHNYILNILTKHESGELVENKYLKIVRDCITIADEDGKKIIEAFDRMVPK